MSTSSPASRRPLKRYRIFDQFVWYNPEVCNNCFSKVKERIKVDVAQYKQSLQPSLRDERHFRVESGVLGYAIEEKGSSEAIRLYRACTTCNDCGSVRAIAHDETLSRQKALEYTANLLDRLEEMGFAVDGVTMRETVRRGKSRPAVQGFDREIFGLAVKLSVVDGPNA